MNNTFKVGAEWRKWDLHVHTPESFNYNGNWEQFIEQLKQTDCEVIGINDYFSVAGYKKLQEQIKAGELDFNKKFFLPVVEMRMTDSLQNKNSKTNSATHFNFHVIFSDQIEVIDIEDFIKRLKCYKTIGETTIGKDYYDKNKLENIKVSFNGVLEELNNDEIFKDQFLIWLPYDEYGGIDKIDPKSDRWIKAYFTKAADIIGTSNDKQIKFFHWDDPKYKEEKDKEEKYKEWLGHKKACIKGSDSHNHNDFIGRLKDKDSKQIEKYCWIKADPTFEGLKQITYEPEERVKIQEENPSFAYNKPFFSNITINNKVSIFENEPVKFNENENIPLNKNLVAFIGGRGTGKSLFLKYIGNRFNKTNDDNEESRFKKTNDDKKFIDNEDFIISYQQENIPNSEVKDFKECNDNLDFVFIEQSKIKDITIENEVFQNAIKKLLGLADTTFDENLQTDIAKIDFRFKEKEKWFTQTDDLNNHINTKKYNESIKAGFENLLDTITTKNNKDKLESYTNNIKEVEKLNNLRTLINKLKIKLKGYEEELNIDITEITKSSSENYPLQEINFNPQINKIDEFITDINKKVKDLEEKNAQVKTEFESTGFKGDLGSLLGNASSYQQKIEQADNKIIQIEKNEKELIKIKNQKRELGEKIKTVYEKHKQALQDKWDNLLTDKNEEQKTIINDIILKEDIEFHVSINFNENIFYWLIYKKVDNRTYKDIDKLKEKFKILTFDQWVSFFSSDRYEKIIQDELFKDFIEDIFFNLNERSQYIQVIPELTYQNKTIDKLSVGQKGTVYLRLQLATNAFSTPIIFDQPEDDLDNEFIITELVPLIQKLKKYRQIIIATHNANLVVNANAEQVIVANYKNELLSYDESGSIENKKIVDSICNILEGGVNAFEKRKNKYSL